MDVLIFFSRLGKSLVLRGNEEDFRSSKHRVALELVLGEAVRYEERLP